MNMKKIKKNNNELIDEFLLKVEYEMKRNGFRAAEEDLQKALDLAKDRYSKQWGIHLRLAQLYEANNKLDESIKHAKKAHEIAEQLFVPDMIYGALQTLIPLQLKKGDPKQRKEAKDNLDKIIEQLRATERCEYLVRVLLQRAFINFEEKKLETALVDINEAEQLASTPELRRHALVSKSITLRSLKRIKEAFEASLQAIELFKEHCSPLDDSSSAWRYMLDHIEPMYEGTALLAAELGRVREAFEYAENGKAWLLCHQLAQTRLDTKKRVWQKSEDIFEEQRSFLATESAAMVQFCVAGDRTLILVLDPKKKNPQTFFVNLGDNELKKMMPSKNSQEWNDVIEEALPELSKVFLPKLHDVVEHCDMLYLVPNSRLFFVPFAALTFDDDTPLVEHCALAYVPSASVLKYCVTHRTSLRKRTCLAVGVGKPDEEEKSDISFAEHAREIAEKLPWADSKWLPEATKEEFLDTSRDYNVLHLSCHGYVEKMVLDMLSASYIEFANKEKLTARDIFNLDGQLHADLVFLNACMSGEFRLHLGSEVGGFWQGFLHAGAISLIATLFYVNPTSAQELAMEFYREWIAGNVTKAESLRRAQLRLRKKKEREDKKDPLHWASHILIGDHL